MKITLDVTLPIVQKTEDAFLNLEGIEVKETIDDLEGVVFKNGYLTQETIPTYNKRIYLEKDISAEYVYNISEPGVSVPNSNEYKFVKKENGSYLFLNSNPKKIEYHERRQELAYNIGDFNSGLEVLEEMTTSLNGFRVYSFPYCGIDKRDLELYYDNDGLTNLLDTNEYDYKIDYLEGLIYISNNYYGSGLVARYNLIPLKIINKGIFKVEDKDSGFYKLENKPDYNRIKIELLDSNSVCVTFLKDCIIRVPEDSYSLAIDGVYFNKNQPIFVSKNEVMLFQKTTEIDELLDEDYLSRNIFLYESFDMYNKDSYLKVVSDNIKAMSGDYFIEIIDKENLNTYLKESPVLIRLF